MLKREFNNIIVNIAKEMKLPMLTVEGVLEKYLQHLEDTTPMIEENYPTISYGIMGLDSLVQCHHGITLISGFDSSGKTSILKAIALAASVSELNTLYHDAENKLFLKQLENIEGMLFTNSSSITPIKDWLHTRLLDIILVDSFTGMVSNSQKLLIHQLRKSVPYVIGATQMRYSFENKCHVPAVAEVILSTCHTRIRITGSEKIKFGELDMKRVYIEIGKYKDQKIEGERGSVVLKDNIACNFHQSLDILRTRGRLTNVSHKRYLDSVLLGTYDEMLYNKELYSQVITAAAEELNVSENCELYISMHGMFYNKLKREEAASSILSEESKSLIPV